MAGSASRRSLTENKPFWGLRSAKVPALGRIAAECEQEVSLGSGLHAFGDDGEAQTVPQGDDRGSDSGVFLVGGWPPDEGAIHPELVFGSTLGTQ